MIIEDAKRKLEHYCAYQERCHKEVRLKLENMALIPEAIDAIIVHLITNNYLNETRFANSFVSGKLRIKHWGKRRLILELKRKGISERIINDAITTIDYDEYLAIFNTLANKKLSQIKETNSFKKKKKLTDYLAYRGWEYQLIYDKVNTLL